MSRRRNASGAGALAARRQRLLRRSDKLRARVALRGQQLEPTFRTADRVINGLHGLRRNRSLWLALGSGVAALVMLRPGAASRLGLGAWSAWQVTHRGRAALDRLLPPRR